MDHTCVFDTDLRMCAVMMMNHIVTHLKLFKLLLFTRLHSACLGTSNGLFPSILQMHLSQEGQLNHLTKHNLTQLYVTILTRKNITIIDLYTFTI